MQNSFEIARMGIKESVKWTKRAAKEILGDEFDKLTIQEIPQKLLLEKGIKLKASLNHNGFYLNLCNEDGILQRFVFNFGENGKEVHDIFLTLFQNAAFKYFKNQN